jgi:aminoglycoside 6'-N-acetyltransferase I
MRVALWPEADAAELRDDVAAFFEGAVQPALLHKVFLAEAPGGAPVGMLELSLRPYADGCDSSPVPFIEGWYVVPEMQRRGIGGALVQAAERWAIAEGYREIASEALIDNRASLEAHAALGFAEVERAIRFRKSLKN